MSFLFLFYFLDIIFVVIIPSRLFCLAISLYGLYLRELFHVEVEMECFSIAR